jgi:glycine amidinotransferase
VIAAVRMKPNFLHLACVIGLVREGRLVVHEEGLIDGLPRALKDWERITATEA